MNFLEKLKKKDEELKEQEDSLTIGETLGEAVTNVPSSAVKLVDDLTMPIRHPIQTATSLLSLGKGVVKLIAPGEPTLYDEDEEAAKAVGKFFADRYGSIDGFKKSFAEDPLGVLSDVSLIFTFGGGAAARVPGITSKVPETIQKIGDVIDPVTGTIKGTGAVIKGAGKIATPALGLTTGVGSDAILAAAKAGASSKEIQKLFLDNLRGKVAPDEIVPKALGALKDRQVSTKTKFVKDKDLLKLEQTPIKFSNLKDRINKFEAGKQFEGISELSVKGQSKLKRIKKIVDEFEKNPKLHNAKGLDILKRRIDAEYPTGINVGDSGVVVTELRNAVKAQILDEVPEYAKVMSDYELAVKLEKQFMSELSLGKNNAAGTTLRKLQSALRDNVNTSYGNRLKMLEELDPNLVVEIGGQALSKIVPRGLQGGLGAGALAYGAIADPRVLFGLPTQSPRLVGEVAFKIGQLEKALEPLKGQRAMDIARAFRLTGEIEGATELDDFELLQILLDAKAKELNLDAIDIKDAESDGKQLEEEIDETDEEEKDPDELAEGGPVISADNVAEKILRSLGQAFSPQELQSEMLNDKIAPLQRISKDANNQKFSDQVFSELEKYQKKINSQLQNQPSPQLQKFKNIVDARIENEIDRGFVQEDNQLLDQLKFSRGLYNSYVGLVGNEKMTEVKDKEANKILEKVIGKRLNPNEMVNFLLSHNKFATKQSIPLFVNKLENSLSKQKFNDVKESLKDGLLKKPFVVSNEDEKIAPKKFNKLLQDNMNVFDALFSNDELGVLKEFESNILPDLVKRSVADPKKLGGLAISTLARGNMFGDKNNIDRSPLTRAKTGLQNLKIPLMLSEEDTDVESDDIPLELPKQGQIPQTQDMEPIQPPNISLQQDIQQFELPQLDISAFEMPETNLTETQLASASILPNEKDREIAQRLSGGIASLV